MTSPCDQCPFLEKMARGFSFHRLEEFAAGPFHCHKTGSTSEEGFVPTDASVHCAGALIYLEKRERPNQMMRIAERLGLYDHRKLDMSAEVR